MMDDVDESYFDWSDDEEDIICSSKYISSDEEDDNLATLTSLQGHRGGGSVFGGKLNQDEQDDFEKAMASELSLTMQNLTSSLGVQGTSGTSQQSTSHQKKPEFYDEIYFDSDESDNEEAPPGQHSKERKQRHHQRHKVLSNDELFYDPTMDDRDQEWVNQKRRSYQPRRRRPGRTLGVENNNTIQLPPSDAVLNCPACLTTLCMDCQRHEIYHNQYRAMFVFNCVVDVTERLHHTSKEQKKQNFIKNKKARKNKKHEEKETKSESGETEEATGSSAAGCSKAAEVQSTNTSASNPLSDTSSTECINGLKEDIYHPVKCQICNTKVAVYDSDEVYHFFNVVTSY